MGSVGSTLQGVLRFVLGGMGALAVASTASAAASTKIGTAPLISPSAADTYYGAATTHTNSTGAGARPAEVQELARALKNDPDLIYEYIRNNTGIVWTYGLTKGAMGVIVDRSGTAFDQAHLMVELLRQSGYTASYNFGTITLTGAQFASWSGITSATAACQLLSSGGIPAAINGATTANCAYGAATITTINVSHAWVSVVIGGVSYVYDPAFKDHSFTTGMNLATATGMTGGAMIGVSATSGTSSGVGWISSVPNTTSSGVTQNLNTYAANLGTALATSLPAAGVADIVGGQAINPQAIPTGGLRQVSLPYTANDLRTVSGDIPNQYRTSLRVQVSKARPGGSTTGVVDKTLYVDDIYGWRLVFDPNFDTSGATFNATLKLVDDFGTVNSLATTGSLSDNPSYSRGDVTLTANLPYAANSGAYMDAALTRTLTYALPFAIVHGWGDEGRGLIDKWGSRRDTAMPAMADMSCGVCIRSYKPWKGDGRRELLAAEWLAQASRAARLHASIASSIFAQHYSLGFAAADTNVLQTSNGSFWITDSFDRLDVETGFSLTSKAAVATDRRAAVLATAATLSVLKGNVTAQVSDLIDASSTATRFEWGNAPDGTDLAGGASRKAFLYATSTDAGFAMALSTTELMTTTSGTGVHLNVSDPPLGNTEVVARRQSLSDAISAYVTAGFSVTASSEAFLGPGTRAGGFIDLGSSTYSHNPTPQRGGALVAVKYDSNGDPTEIAHIAVNSGGLIDGGGGGVQIVHQDQYDPATPADVVKSRFVNRPVGSVSATSPATLTVGAGGFPLALTGQLTWRDGDVRDQTYGAMAHREPQGGWVTPYANNLTISGSGLEAMGDTDARATIGTVAAFYAAQDLYKSSPSLKRDVLGELVAAWWSHNLTQNVATVSVGTSTRQFVRKPDGTWFAPGPGGAATLTQTGAPAALLNRCGGGVVYIATRGWSYAGMSFAVKGTTGDIQTFGAWSNLMTDTATSTCADQHGFRMSGWAWPSGPALTLAYTSVSPTPTLQIDPLAYVTNNLGLRLNLTNEGLGGFDNNLGGPHLRQVTTSAVGAQVSHTDPTGAVSKFDIATIGTGDFAKLAIQNVYSADDATNPSLQYVRDSLGRIQQSRDKLVLAGARGPTQLFLANGLRGETMNALGFSSIVYADLDGRPIRSIDPLGAVTTTVYDGRGRPSTINTPDGGQLQVQYNARNLKTQTTRLANAGSAEAGQTIVNQFDWDPTLSLMTLSKDPKGAQTDYTYTHSLLTMTTYPAAATGAARLTSNKYFYSSGQVLGLATPMGQSVTATYSGAGLSDLTNTVDSLVGDTTVISDPQGDATDLTSPRGAHTTVARDARRRPVFMAGPTVGSAPRVATQATYDPLGRTIKSERGSYVGTTFTPQEASSVEFDAVGNTTKVITPAGVTQYSYDALNRVVCTAVRMNSAVYGSLPGDACAQSTPGPLGPDRITRATYDPAGHVVQTEIGVGTPLQQVSTRYGYSPTTGLQATITDANGNTSTFEYDGFNRMRRLRYPASPRGSGTSSSTDYEEWSYDVNGNVTALRKRDGTSIAYQYDALNRVTVKDLPGTTAADVYLSYNDSAHTMTGRLGSATSPTTFVQQYDAAGRLISDTGYAATFDAEGNLKTVASGGKAFYAYDIANRLTRIDFDPYSGATSGTPKLTISYGPLNRRTSVTRPNGVTTTYAYDAAGRLSLLTHGAPAASDGFVQSMAYSPNGQLASQGQASNAYVWSGQPTTTANFTHDQLNRDAAMAAASGYDANGNLVSDGVRTFAYDAENRLTSVTGGAAAVTLAYDPFGRLYQYTTGGTTTTFAYGGALLMKETNRDYVYDGDQPVLWREGADGGPDLRWLHQDRLGSVIGTSSPSGVMTPYAYGPYGEPQSWAGSRFRYTGQIAIPEAQLYHYRARAYDPMMGRFLQTDPIRYGDGPNIYAYVHGDPVNGSDPTGMLEPITVNPSCWGSSGFGSLPACGNPFGNFLPTIPFPGFGAGGVFSNAPSGGISQFITQDMQDARKQHCKSGLSDSKKDQAGVDRAFAAWSTISSAASAHGIDPAMLAAVGVRETDFRDINQPGGKGMGVFQIDHGANPNVSQPQADNLSFAANFAASALSHDYQVLSKRLGGTDLLEATFDAYNRGLTRVLGLLDEGSSISDITRGSANHDYGSNLVDLMNCFL